jgi:hypothetical protein
MSPRSNRKHSAGDERGVAIVWSLALVAMIGLAAFLAAAVGGLVVTRQEASTIADLAAVALPRLAPSPQPFTIVEYFPSPEVTGFHDPRQHAVSLAFVVPMGGDCSPSSDALDLAWVSPDEAVSLEFEAEMSGGQGRLIRLALAHCGVLP